MNKPSGCGIFLACIGLLLCVIIIIGAVSGGSSPAQTTPPSKTCQVCNRSFTDSANMQSIRLTNMCKNCYKNFEYAMKATGKW